MPAPVFFLRGPLRRGIAFCLLGCLAHATVSTALAQLPTTRLSTVHPAGGQRGTTFDLTLTGGQDLDGVSQLLFSHPGITAEQKTAPNDQGEATPVANQFSVTIAPTVPGGLHEVRALGTYGLSNPRIFVVSSAAEVVEVEPNDTSQTATAVPVSGVANGVIAAPLDIDWFRFDACEGERIRLEVTAERLDSPLDATLEVYTASEQLLGKSLDAIGRDPVIDFTAPATGTYLVRVTDLLYRGTGESNYRLTVSTAPQVAFVFPPSGQAGTTGEFQLYGMNLPGSEPTDLLDAAGQPLEKVTVHVPLPEISPAAAPGQWSSPLAPASAALDAVNYAYSTEAGEAPPISIGLATVPVTSETATPNETAATAMRVEVPTEIAGRFDPAGDLDWYQFSANEGDVYWIEMISARRGLPTDPYALIQQVVTAEDGSVQVTDLQELDDFGATIGGAMFNTAHRDFEYRLVAPATADYRILVRDMYGETLAGPHSSYRLIIRPETPDFRLVAMPAYPVDGVNAPQPWSTLVRRGGTERLRIMLFRKDNFNGEVIVTAEDLPAGVTAAPLILPPGQTAGDLILVAAADAAEAPAKVRIVGTATLGDSTMVREARGATFLRTGPPAAARATHDIGLAVAGNAPLLLEASGANAAGELELFQSTMLPLHLKLTRYEGFTGPVPVTGDNLLPNITNTTVTIAAEASEGILPLYIPQDTAPVRCSLNALATPKVRSPKPDGNGNPQDIDVTLASTPVTIHILPGPLVIAPDAGDGQVKRGGERKIPVKITRRAEFTGPVTLGLYLPVGPAGITASEVTIPAEADTAELLIESAADAPVGAVTAAAVSARLTFADRETVLHAPLPLNIIE